MIKYSDTLQKIYFRGQKVVFIELTPQKNILKHKEHKQLKTPCNHAISYFIPPILTKNFIKNKLKFPK